MSRLLASTAMLAASVGLAAAPKPAGPDPALTRPVTSGQNALRKLDWKTYAELIHPESLKEFRSILVPVLEAAKQRKIDSAGLLEMFDGAKDIDSVLEWEPKEFFVRFMKATTKGPMKDIYASTKSSVLGAVREGDDQAHAVIRTTRTFGKVEMKRVEVVSLRKHQGAWKLSLGDEVRGLAETIKLSVGGGNVGKDTRTDQVDPDPAG